MCSDEERVWWKCDTLYFGSLAIDDGSCDGLRGRVDFAVVMKCEEGHERSRSALPYGKEIRLGVNPVKCAPAAGEGRVLLACGDWRRDINYFQIVNDPTSHPISH